MVTPERRHQIDDEARFADAPLRLVTLYAYALAALRDAPGNRISQETLARKLNVTMRTAQRHLQVLEDAHLIAVDRTHKPFRYTIDESAQVEGVSVGDVLRLI